MVKRCAKVTRGLLNFARHLNLSVQTINLEEIIDEVKNVLAKEAEFRSITVEIKISENLPQFKSDRGKLEQIFFNLFNHATGNMNDGGYLEITGRLEDTDSFKDRVALITMGGIPGHVPFIERLNSRSTVGFIIPGGSDHDERQGNIRLLPIRSDCFHPDLVRASDAVIGKVGYSTLAEAYYAGVPFGYIRRDHFRESDILVSFIKKEMQGMPIHEYYSGEWVTSLLPQLLDLPKIRRRDGNGDRAVAEFICHKILRGA